VSHLPAAELEALIMGSAAPTDAQRRHLAACPECAARLAREARLESAFYEIAAESGNGGAPRWSDALRVAWPLAAAALVLLGLSRLMAEHGLPVDRVVSQPITDDIGRPCMIDPRLVGPGHDAVAPSDFALWCGPEPAPLEARIDSL